MAKISFFELEDWEEEKLRQAFPNDELFFSRERLTTDNLPSDLETSVICIFTDSRIDSLILDRLPNVKLVTTRSTGYDHIDQKQCQSRGVSVAYVPGYGDNTVAEYTFGLMLNLTRKIYLALDRVKETGSFDLTGLRGMDLKGKTLGVVGTGRIGKEVIKVAKGFSMNVLAFVPHPDETLAKDLGFSYVGLSQLLSTCDIVTLHCPLTAETHHLINRDNIVNFKKGSFLINTARGGLVDTEALWWALDQKILAGAALDVLEEEGEIKDEMNFISHGHPNPEVLKKMVENHLLMKMSNVLISPHNAFNSKEALERILQMTIENISGFLKNKPVNLVSHDH